MLDEMLDGKRRAIHFLAHLHHVTTVDEDRGAVGKHDGNAR